MRTRRALGVAALVMGVAAGCSGEPAPLALGVLLPLTAPNGSADLRAPLQWAVDNVNAAGGIEGRPLRLELVDRTAESDLAAAAMRLANAPEIVAIVGPGTSQDLFATAPMFLAAQKPLVSPAATAGDVFRAFGGKKYIWRTVESDVAQTQVLLTLARRDGAQRVALVVPDDGYGGTFFDWFGFFARELGLEVTAIERYDGATSTDCATLVERARAGLVAPDALVIVPNDVERVACLARAVEAVPSAARPRVLYSDLAENARVVAGLGVAAEGMEGLTAVADPASGFDAAYAARFGEGSAPYAARTYDAVALIAYGLAASHGAGGEALADGMARAVDGRGAATGWDADGIRAALAALQRGERPNVSGSAGALDFDPDDHTDLVASTYGHWRVKDGAFAIDETFSTARGRTDGARSIYRTLASEAQAQTFPTIDGPATKPRTGAWAAIVATSSGWANYRHQADSLAHYRALKANGFGDDRIVLALADDLATDPANRAPGTVRNEVGGDDLRAGAVVDHRLASLSLDGLATVLTTLPSRDSDDVILFLTGHGTVRGLGWSGDPSAGTLLTPVHLADIAVAMRDAGRYRRLLVIVDACDAGAMASEIVRRAVPGVLVLASSTPHQDSLATHWDPSLGVWLADEFSYRIAQRIRSAPNALLDVYRDAYLHVPGSHVTAYNAESFGNLATIQLSDFVVP